METFLANVGVFVANWSPTIHNTAPLIGTVGVFGVVAIAILLSLVLKPVPTVKSSIGKYPSERTQNFFRGLQFWDRK